MLDPPAIATTATDHALIQKVLRRLIPLCILCFLLNYLDRTNISIAQYSMIQHIPGFTPEVFTLGLTIFFIPYCLFELPSSLIQQRVGPRRWIARIMITWGIVSACFIFIRGPTSFYILRALMGLAEAGFFPGILLYLSYWVPHRHRARASALFFLSQAIAQVIGNSLGGYILYLAGKYHLPGDPWQWLFLLEGLPAILMGFVVLLYLTDKPADAAWLSPPERSRLTDIMAADRQSVSSRHPLSGADLKHALASPYTWLLSLLYSLMVWAYYPVNSYTPAILRGVLTTAGIIHPPATLPSTTQSTLPVPTPEHLVSLYTGLLTAIPFTAAALTMLAIARHSDQRNERKFHIAFTCSLMAIGLALAALAPRLATGNTPTILTLIGLSLGAVGWFGTFAVFWSVPPQLLTGSAVAASLAIINSIGNFVGNFIGPRSQNYFGLLGHAQMSQPAILLVAAACALLATLLALALKLPKAAPAVQP